METRPLTVAECKRVQQFPDEWFVSGTVAQQYRQIGNAVPIGLGKALGMAILAASAGELGYDDNPELEAAVRRELPAMISVSTYTADGGGATRLRAPHHTYSMCLPST